MLVPRPLFSLVVLAVAPLAFAGDVAHGRFTSPPDREFQVLAAQWGTGHRWVDVTEKACELSTENGLDVAAVRKHFGDPYPHFTKALVVFYLWRGEIRSATAREDRRLRIPVRDEKAAAAAVRDAAKARLERIEREIEAAQAEARELVEKAVREGPLEGIRKSVKKRRKLAKDSSLRLAPRFDDLATFFARHPSSAADPGLAEIREQAARAKAGFEDWVERTKKAKKEMREVTVKVASTSDWRDLEIDAAKGDLVAFEAEGSWKLGTHAGSCDATGLSGDRYASCSTIGEFRHGCLLVRVGSNLFAAGKASGATRATEEGARVEATCNDNTYRDNSGSITIRVLVVPGTE